MSDKRFSLDDRFMPFVEEIGRHMPGGFFIYKAAGDTGIIYANKAVYDIFGCGGAEEFNALTGGTFRGMVHPDDIDDVMKSIESQISSDDDGMDYVEYRVIRKDGGVRWVDDYGHYTETEKYGGVFYVFISDITEKREKMESVNAVRAAVIEALSESYHTVWLINDVETESFSLYRGDVAGDTVHAAPIREALKKMKYSQAKEFYIKTTVAPSDRERLEYELDLHTITSNLEGGRTYNVTYLRIMDDGSERYFRIEFAALVMPGGKRGVVCGFRDVDDEIREETAIKDALAEGIRAKEENRRLTAEVQSAAQLADLMGSVASLLSNMPAMSFSKDANTGVYLACNQSFAEYAGKSSPDEVIGLTDHEIFDRDTADHFVKDDKKAIGMGKPYVFFEDVPDAAGSVIRNLQTTKLVFTDRGGRECLLGMCVDVTALTRMKESEARRLELEHRLALQEELSRQNLQSEQQMKLITALSSDFWSVYYIELDNDEGICYQAHSDVDGGFKVGERFRYLESVTAYAKKYIVPEYLDDFLAFIQPDNIRQGLKNQRVISFRYKVRRHGHDSYEAVRFAGVRHPEDRDDGLVHTVGACFENVDAETRKSMAKNRALSDALAAAEQASKAKTVFLSNMSHEIRTPMNAIIGLDSIALSDPDLPQKTREHLEKIGASANHLLSIINDILDMSRIESGRMTIKKEEFSFPKTLEQVNTIIAGQCRDKRLEYECRICGRVADRYIGDGSKIRQIMINILGNSVKFTPEGGKVTMTVEEVNRIGDMAALRFVFSDTGIGMSADYLPKLFDPFTQEDGSSTSKYGSTGLGMPITKSLVEMMNGTIEVQSEKGRGTTFTVTVSLGVCADEEKEDISDLHPHDLSVLAIDDDPVACEHARLVLGQIGISCDTATSGREGVEMAKMRHLRRDPYDLILVDWKMPEMDGVETTKKIREAVGSESAVIILTSYSWEEIIDEAREAGVDSFVPKPLFANTVMDEFRDAFRKKNEKLMRDTVDLRGRHILLAEDMDVNAEIMVMVLSMREMEADVASNGKEAVELFEKSEPGYYDAILMDMRMPEMDGLEATKIIRALDRPDAKSVPIIALTANAFDEDVQRSMQAGLNAHLSKPVEPETLFETLEGMVKR